MSTSNTSENNIINKISKKLLKKIDPSIVNDVIKDIPKQLYKNLKKNNLLKKEKEYEEILSKDDYKKNNSSSESLETNSEYISSTNLPYNIPIPVISNKNLIHTNDLYQDDYQPKYDPTSYIPPKIISTGFEGFDQEDNKNQDVPAQVSSTKETTTQETTTQNTTNQQPSQQSEQQNQQPNQQPKQQQMQQQTQQPMQQPNYQDQLITSLPLNVFALDIRQLLSFTLKAIGDTYNAIYMLYTTNTPITIMSIISILLTDNRILYLGIGFLLIAILMYIFNNFIRIPSLFGIGGSEKKVYINNY